MILKKIEVLLTGEYLDGAVAGGIVDSCPFTCVFCILGAVTGEVEVVGIVGDGHFVGWDTCRARGVVDGGGNMGFWEGLIRGVVGAAVVSAVGWLSLSTPLINGGVGCRLGGVIDIGSVETATAGEFWTGSEGTLPGNSSKIE